MVGLSLLARGSLAEKLQWVFNLYDVNRDGQITKDEMLDIISSIYDMMGRFAEPCIEENTARQHVDRIFEVRCCCFCVLPPSSATLLETQLSLISA